MRFDRESEWTFSTLRQDSQVECLAWTSDQKKLIAGVSNGSIRIFNTTTWEQMVILGGHTKVIYAISLLQNDRFLASASLDKTARMWNLNTNLAVGPPLLHRANVWDAALSADGKFLVTACGDNNAHVWNTDTILEEAGLEDLLSLPNIVSVRIASLSALSDMMQTASMQLLSAVCNRSLIHTHRLRMHSRYSTCVACFTIVLLFLTWND